MEQIVIYLSTVQRLLNLKQNIQKFVHIMLYYAYYAYASLCFGNISKDWSQDTMKKTGFNGYIYDFSSDYNAITVPDIQDIHKYLMKKSGII